MKSPFVLWLGSALTVLGQLSLLALVFGRDHQLFAAAKLRRFVITIAAITLGAILLWLGR